MSEENREYNRENEAEEAGYETGEASGEREAEDQSAGPELSREELERLCRENVCPDCPEKLQMEQEVARVRADADNFRKRMAKEKDQHCKYATESLLGDILPVLDNLELALQHGRKVQESCSDMVQGVEMTNKVMLDTLKKHGLSRIEIEPGEEFDPKWQEAMYEEEREDMERGRVCQVIQTGYILNDRLLRPAKVIVSKECEN
ncbi:MAG: nucleotide exchange factor GrpE [Desulfohalobiaceae bacterium]|nr:nucleotide exchange factor GrpE [Desulfohalobiaceae bacterium]